MALKINVDSVQSVYSGINGKCCCGCSGKHTYASKHQQAASKDRGYDVSDDEVNDKVVSRVVRKIERSESACLEDGYVSTVIGKRLYIAYLV